MIAGWSQIRLTVFADPWTLSGQPSFVFIAMGTYTLTTPGGIPALSQSSAMIIVAPGSLSDGLTTKVLPDCQTRSSGKVKDLPVTVANAADHKTILTYQHPLSSTKMTYMAGKLNGVIAAQTPRGNLLE